jgi:uncharacterized protein YigE (DUF2233 family)
MKKSIIICLIIISLFINKSYGANSEGLEFTQKIYKLSQDTQVTIYMIQINPDLYDLSIYYGNKKGITIEDLKKDKKIEAAINCGFFKANFSPVGLLISHGKTINQIDKSWDHTGVFYMTGNNSDPYGICTKDMFYDTDVTEAVQSYPLLIWEGQPYVKNDRIDKAVRSAIALDGRGHIFLIITDEEISLYDFSRALCTLDYHFTRALNLDGGTSTQIYIKNKLAFCPSHGLFQDNSVSNMMIVKRKDKK